MLSNQGLIRRHMHIAVHIIRTFRIRNGLGIFIGQDWNHVRKLAHIRFGLFQRFVKLQVSVICQFNRQP